ncbi:hypothetical protein ACS0TY_001908 [Phlomoides rotata]
MLLMKPFYVAGVRCMSKLAKPNQIKATKKDLEGPATAADKRQPPEKTTGFWVPHHRNGIYFPKGQEWVMEDIPNDAATFDCTFWLRSIDGVDDHKPYNENILHD